MTQIFKFFIDNWKFSFLLTFMIFISGIMSLDLLQKESFPPVNFAVVSVDTVYPGASSEEVHDKVTKIIEDELRGIEGIKDVRSISQNNMSSITIRIDIDNIDTTKVVTDIQNKVQRASSKLPSEVTEDPVVTEINAKEIPILELGLVGDNSNRKRDLLADKLKESLEDVKGVSSVRLSGYNNRELQVLIDQKKLRNYGLSLADIFLALSSQIKNIPSGFLDDKQKTALVRVVGKNTTVGNLENLIIRSNDAGTIIKVKDIAKVQEGAKRPEVIASVNGEEATLIIVTKKADADAIDVLKKMNSSIENFKKNLDPNFNLLSYNDEGQRIINRLNIVNFNAISGMIIVIIVLFVFLPGKIGLFSSLSLPISALTTVCFMVFYGANFNIITMIALVICLGNLVDNSVVISEYYTTLREKGVEAKQAALGAANQFWIPFTASTITIICAFLPMLVTKGVMGQFIMWIPIIVTIALTVSLIESVTLLPARLQFLNPQTKSSNDEDNEHAKNRKDFFTILEDKFGSFISLTLKHKYITAIGLTVLVLISGVFNAVFNRFELFPAEGVEYYIGRFQTTPDTSIYQTKKYGTDITLEVKKLLDPKILDSIITRVGIQQTDPTDPRAQVGEHVGLISIGIKPELASTVDIQETLKKLNAIKAPKGITHLNFEPIENGPPVGKPLTITIRSSNHQQLAQLKEEFNRELSKLQGLINLDDDENETGVEYRFTFDDVKRAFAGVNTDLIGLNLRTALEGNVVQELTENGKKFDLVVRFQENDKTDIKDLNQISIVNQRGVQIPLTSLGNFNETKPPKTIKNYDYKKSITFSADVDNIKLTSRTANLEAKKLLEPLLIKYPDVTFVVGGEEESTNESLQSLAVALVLAIFGIFATLVFTFKSFSSPFLILSTIPLGLVGVFFSFTLLGRPLSFLAFIGVVGLTGVVINSAIILVDYINELIADKKDDDIFDLLVTASKKRLRAVLATGLTTVVGLLPSAFGWGGYDAVLVDITLALSWGMIIGTVLSLLWIPSGYLILFNLRNKIKNKFLASR